MAKFKLQIILTLVMFASLTALNYYAPKKIDWRFTFDKNDKIPYGTYAFFQLLPQIFPNQNIETNDLHFYEYIENTNSSPKNILIVNTDLYAIDSLDLNSLLEFAENGGKIFISSNDFRQEIEKKFKIKTSQNTIFTKDSVFEKSYFTDKNLSASAEQFSFDIPAYYFTRYNSLITKVLGKNSTEKPEFIVLKHGKGQIFLHTRPEFFTNYGILHKKNHQYIATLLSYLPIQQVIWDESTHLDSERKTSVMKFIFSQESLFWAWQIGIVGMWIFVFFGGKRQQRPIPVVKPVRNSSLDFVQTIGLLYFNKQNNKDLAQKKFQLFCEKIKFKYNFSIRTPDFETAQHLAARLGVEEKWVNNIFSFYKKINVENNISSDNLIKFNNFIEDLFIQIEK